MNAVARKFTNSKKPPKPKNVLSTNMDSSSSDSEDETLILLETRKFLTERLAQHPYDLVTYLERAGVHTNLGYPDLAAGDAYRALLLTDEVRDESFEYHEEALNALTARCEEGIPSILKKQDTDADPSEGGQADDRGEDTTPLGLSRRAAILCYQKLAISLLLCGCLKSAYEFCTRGLEVAPDDENLLFKRDNIEALARRKLNVGREAGDEEDVDINDLPDQGLVRREIYPWNQHEPDRFSDETLDFLNAELRLVAPKVEVHVTELPTLIETPSSSNGYTFMSTNRQLGLFATEDIERGETVLDEFSTLTANNRLNESLCDACSAELPPLGPGSTVVGCPECYDTMFCNEECLERAAAYHPSVCNKEIDIFGKDPEPKETPNALYLLLLGRTLAMAETQDCHPLQLKEVRYIWGDFLPSRTNAVPLSLHAPPPIWTLPFSFASNIFGPLHILEKMELDIFASLAQYDLWVINTLYSKFRGTASARVNKRDGRVEVAAVHPLWCLANHDCDPNVQWEWGGRMKLWCREKRVGGGAGGIKKGEEILSHYCDINLKVHARREWAKGSLGGWCMCGRCRREASEEKDVNGHGAENSVA